MLHHLRKAILRMQEQMLDEFRPYALSYLEHGNALCGPDLMYDKLSKLQNYLLLADEGRKYCEKYPAESVEPSKRAGLTNIRMVDKSRREFWGEVMEFIAYNTDPETKKKRKTAAIEIQQAWRMCRWNPAYKMCETVQFRNLKRDTGLVLV